MLWTIWIVVAPHYLRRKYACIDACSEQIILQNNHRCWRISCTLASDEWHQKFFAPLTACCESCTYSPHVPILCWLSSSEAFPASNIQQVRLRSYFYEAQLLPKFAKILGNVHDLAISHAWENENQITFVLPITLMPTHKSVCIHCWWGLS